MKIFLLFLPVFLVSCSSYDLHTPASRMLSPEAQGDVGRVSAELRLNSYRKDEPNFVNNVVNRPVKHADPAVAISANGELGIWKRIDVYANPNFMVNAPNIAGLKYQILGKTRTEAGRNNFSLSVNAGLGRQQGGDQTSSHFLGDFLHPENVKKVSYTTNHQEMGLNAGYRWGEKFLQYLSANYFHQSISGEVTTNHDVLKDHRFNFSQDGMIYSTGLLHYFGGSGYYKIDWSIMKSAMSFGDPRTHSTLNGAIGFTW